MMDRRVTTGSRAPLRFATRRHLTPYTVGSLQAGNGDGGAIAERPVPLPSWRLTQRRSLSLIERRVKNRRVELAVRNIVLGFGKRTRLLYRLPDGTERVAMGRKGEPAIHLVRYIRKVYPDAALIACTQWVPGLQVDETGAFAELREWEEEE